MGWSDETAASRPGRRTVLLVAATLAGAGLTALTGCTGGGTGPSTRPSTAAPSVDELARRRAVARVQALLAGAAQLGLLQPALRPLLDRVGADHRAQLGALGAPAATATSSAPGSAGSATTSASGSAGSPMTSASGSAGSGSGPAPSGSAAGSGSTPAATAAEPTPAAAVAAELSVARQSGADCLLASAGMAVLLARVAAGCAVHADLIAGRARLPAPGPLPAFAVPAAGTTGGASATASTGTSGGSAGGTSAGSAAGASTGSATVSAPGTGSSATAGLTPGQTPSQSPVPLDDATSAALSRMLAGEHAAVYAYGVVTARVAAPLRPLAQSCWAAHVASRDSLQQQLILAGLTPPPAAAGYDLGPMQPGSPGAVALAARVEAAVAAVAADAVAATKGSYRAGCAGALVAAARRQAAWTATPLALPG